MANSVQTEVIYIEVEDVPNKKNDSSPDEEDESPPETDISQPIENSSSTRKQFYARYVGELVYDDFSTPEKAKHSFKLIKNTLMKDKRRFKSLTQKNNRLIASVDQMKELIVEFSDQGSVTPKASEVLLRHLDRFVAALEVKIPK